MEKIKFKDGKKPYLNAENLNKIQDNVEYEILIATPDVYPEPRFRKQSNDRYIL